LGWVFHVLGGERGAPEGWEGVGIIPTKNHHDNPPTPLKNRNNHYLRDGISFKSFKYKALESWFSTGVFQESLKKPLMRLVPRG
jgi:hypothetical protein